MYLYHRLGCWLKILSNGVHGLRCRILIFGGSNGMGCWILSYGGNGLGCWLDRSLGSPYWLWFLSSTIIFSKSTMSAPIVYKTNATLSSSSFVVSLLRVVTSLGSIVLDWVATHSFSKAFFNPMQTLPVTARYKWLGNSYENTNSDSLFGL